MVFSSVSFLFLLLPLVLCCTILLPQRFRNHVLFAASILFYFWGEGVFTLILLCSVVLNHFLARQIEKCSGKRQNLLLAAGVCCNLLPLFFFKYADFFLQILHVDYRFSPHLPAGISFFTFQAISYLVDVSRKIVPAEKRILNCGLYISMFPQLIAGPIVRYHDIAKQLVERTISRSSFAGGVERFVFGLAKKVLLADALGIQADAIFSIPLQELTLGQAWLGAICFSLQIYYDFSGYSDMAIGLGKMFGFTLPENFNYPYVARSMRDFWHRWHISLSTWLRDYLYIPLGGNRCSSKRNLFNLLLVFTLCGLWHGAAWTFVAWGLWHGLFLVIERIVPGDTPRGWLFGLLGWLYTSLVVLIGWVLFRSPSIEGAFSYLMVMAGFGDAGGVGVEELGALFSASKFSTEFIVSVILAFPVYRYLKNLPGGTEGLVGQSVWGGSVSAVCRVALFSLLLYCTLITIAAQAYQPFLYFQF